PILFPRDVLRTAPLSNLRKQFFLSAPGYYRPPATTRLPFFARRGAARSVVPIAPAQYPRSRYQPLLPSVKALRLFPVGKVPYFITELAPLLYHSKERLVFHLNHLPVIRIHFFRC